MKNYSRLSETPVPPRDLDMAIANAHGSSVALEASHTTLQASKQTPDLSLKEIIELKTKENSRLRAEVAYLHNMRKIGEELAEEVDYVLDKLRLAIVTFNRDKDRAERSV
ncbi:hypothetical protein COL26b_010260 [Colletotrichum chrysophilum]|uniref:uncharacterized protein n=1 Tax=Colletotrichum chrysophilum TaxID=1836956 RepID=UPI002301C926|nr:uncharacterized protein COL26b_010260 [Colletotrichum chrysophilum]KAJ0370056.1 hypothetical protein COL26b_010260 [Colletotrichum chrysophilum]